MFVKGFGARTEVKQRFVRYRSFRLSGEELEAVLLTSCRVETPELLWERPLLVGVFLGYAKKNAASRPFERRLADIGVFLSGWFVDSCAHSLVESAYSAESPEHLETFCEIRQEVSRAREPYFEK